MRSSRAQVPAKWFWATFLLSASANFIGMTIGFHVDSPMDALGAIPTIQLLMMQASGFGPPQNLMHDEIKPLRYPNLLHWCNKIFLTLNFHHVGNARADAVLKMYDLRTGQVDACFQALALCFVATGFFAAGSCYRSLTKERSAAGARPGRKPRPKLETAPSFIKKDTDDDAAAPEFTRGRAATTAAAMRVSPHHAIDDGDDDDDLELGAPAEGPRFRAPAVACDGLTTIYPGSTKQTLKNVSADFEGSTALMGPSGAGKTSLMNALGGRNWTAVVGGAVTVDGAELKPAEFREFVQFTPQEDTLLTGLTVAQTFDYAALLYGPSDAPDSEKLARAAKLVDALGLRHRADLVVSSGAAAGGLSGGQKKRVSIGIDLLAEKPVMLVPRRCLFATAFKDTHTTPDARETYHRRSTSRRRASTRRPRGPSGGWSRICRRTTGGRWCARSTSPRGPSSRASTASCSCAADESRTRARPTGWSDSSTDSARPVRRRPTWRTTRCTCSPRGPTTSTACRSTRSGPAARRWSGSGSCPRRPRGRRRRSGASLGC